MNQAGGPKGRTAAKLTVRERFHTVCLISAPVGVPSPQLQSINWDDDNALRTFA